MITLAQLAERAGVSAMTVSRALRGQGAVAAETAARIRHLADSMGYRADPVLSALARRRRGAGAALRPGVAIVTSFPTRDAWRAHPYHVELHAGAHAGVAALGYLGVDYWIKPGGGRRVDHTRILRARGVTGLILLPTSRPEDRLTLDFQAFVCVGLGTNMRPWGLHTVNPTHFHNLQNLWVYLRAQGARRIGLVLTGEDQRRSNGRWLGAYLAQGYFEPAHLPVCFCEAGPARAPFQSWLRQHQPDAIITHGAEPWAGWIASAALAGPPPVQAVLDAPAQGSLPGVHQSGHQLGWMAAVTLHGLLAAGLDASSGAIWSTRIEGRVRGEPESNGDLAAGSE